MIDAATADQANDTNDKPQTDRRRPAALRDAVRWAWRVAFVRLRFL